MEEIQIGEYVRTKYYGIKRIDTIFENRPVNRYGYEIGSDWDGKEYSIIKTTEIVKHSKNIIDLIEEGDIVNGEKVIEIFEIYNNEELIIGKRILTEYRKAQYTGLNNNYYLYENDIKTILTHEQYENNCFRTGE